MTTFLDTSAVIAIYKEADPHHEWAKGEVQNSRVERPLVVTDVVYAEFSVTFDNPAAVDEAIVDLGLERLRADDEVLFRAGQACLKFQKAHGRQGKTLPDYFVGASAEVAGCPLMTANPRDFAKSFPTVQLIMPPTPPKPAAPAAPVVEPPQPKPAASG